MFPVIFFAVLFLGIAGGAFLFEDRPSEKENLPEKKDNSSPEPYIPNINNINRYTSNVIDYGTMNYFKDIDLPNVLPCIPSRDKLEFDFTSRPKDPIDELMEDIRRERRENELDKSNTSRFHYPVEEIRPVENITEETADYEIDDLHFHEDLEINKKKRNKKTKYPRYFE